MIRALAAAKIDEWRIVPPTGLGHPILSFQVDGRTVRIPLPTTTSSGRSARYVPAEIHRAVRGVTRGGLQIRHEPSEARS